MSETSTSERTMSRRETGVDPNAALNLHKGFPLQCGLQDVASSVIHPGEEGLLHMALWNPNKPYLWGHRKYHGKNMTKAVELLSKVQSCLYTFLDYWWELAEKHNMTRWSLHGGSAMSAYCHRSANPWDDDIDLTVSSCDALLKLFDEARNVSDVHPDIDFKQYNDKVFEGRLLPNDEWILLKGPTPPPHRKKNHNNFFKLKHVNMTRTLKEKDLSGIDIMCMDQFITHKEIDPMNESGFESYLKGNAPLQTVQFGPTFAKVVPYPVLEEYVFQRYHKRSFCDFPYEKDRIQNRTISQPRSSQLQVAVSKWYTTERQRLAWLDKVGKVSGKELTKEVPNLDEVEIDNSIAAQESCQISAGRPLKVIAFNHERGTYWSAFADMVRTREELEKPDVIILNEMDIGMARSGNLHTTRKLAFELGMNYAWGLEFIELTRGTEKEQNATEGTRNSMGLHGNAILSTCKLYDPLVVRHELGSIYFSNKTNWENAYGYEKRLGGRMALFARTGHDGPPNASDDTFDERHHVIVGSVHKLGLSHQDEIWKYFGTGWPRHDSGQNGTARQAPPNRTESNRTGIILAGDFDGRKFCGRHGLHNLDLNGPILNAFRADCSRPDEALRSGRRRGDCFCGNMAQHQRDRVVAPCFTQNGTTTQIADHAILEITLQA